jgi:hypothetical protein
VGIASKFLLNPKNQESHDNVMLTTLTLQTALHEGVPVAPGSVKYMLRADALFR